MLFNQEDKIKDQNNFERGKGFVSLLMRHFPNWDKHPDSYFHNEGQLSFDNCVQYKMKTIGDISSEEAGKYHSAITI